VGGALAVLALLGLAAFCAAMFRVLRARGIDSAGGHARFALLGFVIFVAALGAWLLCPERPKGLPGGDDAHEGRQP
jgi:hypothetical protein